MRPGALTQAARSAASRREVTQPRSARPARPRRPPRRVSGPAGGKAAARVSPGARSASTARRARATSAVAFAPVGALRVTAAARAAAVALPLPVPGFRRAPKPVFRPAPRPAPAPRRERGSQGVAQRVLAFAAALPDHAWLDRVVRGRVWIPLLGVLLAGIVAAQVEILKTGASMGQALEQTSTLTTQNEQLRGNVAALADDQRIERLATGMGMVLPPPGAVGYLAAGPGGNLGAALGNLHTPDAAAFVALAAKNGALVTGAGTSTLPPAPGAPAPPPAATTPNASGSTSATTSSTATPSQSSATTSQLTPTVSQSTTTPQTTAQATPTQATPTQPAPAQQSATQQTPATNSSTGSPATGAAAIQPASSSQTGGGG